MYVCTYVRMYVRTYVCMYVCMYVRMYVRTYVCMYVCMYVRTYVCMYVCIHIVYCHAWNSVHSNDFHTKWRASSVWSEMPGNVDGGRQGIHDHLNRSQKKREEQKLDSHLRVKKRWCKESTKCWSEMGSHLPTCEINHEPWITKPLKKKKKTSPLSWVKTPETSKIKYEHSQKSLIESYPFSNVKNGSLWSFLSGWLEQNRRRHRQRNTPLHGWPVCLRSLIASSWSPGLKRRWQEGILRNPGLENGSSTRLQSF